MCEHCGCAERRTSRQDGREIVGSRIPIRIPVIALPLEQEAAAPGEAGEVEERTLESGAPDPA